jgi:hypothetical protein
VGFLGRENPFLTVGYRIEGRRLRPLIQPSDLPRSLGGRAGVPNRAKIWGGDKEVYEIDCIRVAARIPC